MSFSNSLSQKAPLEQLYCSVSIPMVFTQSAVHIALQSLIYGPFHC